MDEQTTPNPNPSPAANAGEGGGEPIAARYVGGGLGAFWPGVPQCDLTVSQWETLEPSLRAMLLAQKIYVVEA